MHRGTPDAPRRRRTVRRTLAAALLALGATVVASPLATGGTTDDAEPSRTRDTRTTDSPPQSTYFSTLKVKDYADVGAPTVGDGQNHGDLWPNCWADDDHIYAAYGDGIGFEDQDYYSDIGVARISGTPGDLEGTSRSRGMGKVWNADHTRKPTGMACVDGDLYLAVQDLALDFNDVPAATVLKSTDKGATWEFDESAPMFDNGVFTTVMFLDYGKDYANAPDDYVYAYGLDHNWRDSFNDRVPDPVDVYLARVPKDAIMDRSAWEFVSGFDEAGEPTWSGDIGDRAAVLHDDRHIYQDVYTEGRARNMTVISQGGIVYNKPLDRYLYTSWTEYTYEFYESPTPWGPWKRVGTKDFGGYPWTHTKHGGYATTIPSKFISDDGRDMWLQSNVCPCGGGYPPDDFYAYTFSVRPLHLEPYVETTPENSADAERNLAQEDGTVPIERATHYGNTAYYNDGDRQQNEDDWNDERKDTSWWGYTWPREYRMNQVTYTTGEMFDDGGWFSGDLRVQVRHDHTWQDVTGLEVSPDYPNDESAGTHQTYTFTFDATDGDGVRIIGTPGGSRTFTSLAELEVHYAPDGAARHHGR